MSNGHFKDPLTDIFERHLFRSSAEKENSTAMIQAVVDEYLVYLKSSGVHIPGPVKEIFIQDLKEEIRDMSIKRTHGAVLPEIEDAQVNPNPLTRPTRKVA